MDFKIDKNRMILYGAAAVFAVITICMFIPEKKDEQPQEEKIENAHADVPDGEKQEMSDSKITGYEKEPNRNSAATEYWNQAEDITTPAADIRESSEKIFGAGAQQPAPTYTYPSSSYTNPYRETPQEREERHRRRQEEAIELAERFAGEENQEEVTPTEETSEKRSVYVTRKSAYMSSLDSEESNGGISSLDDDQVSEISSESHPFKCMFAKESKIKNGQRVSVILMEDLVVAGTPVPKNTHLMARCKLSDRLELEFENIEIGGRILYLGYEAYDVDGSRGIYCPDVSGTGKQVRSRGSNIISSTLSGKMGRIASEVLSSGVSIAQSVGGEVTVSVPAGYTFYIVKVQR